MSKWQHKGTATSRFSPANYPVVFKPYDHVVADGSWVTGRDVEALLSRFGNVTRDRKQYLGYEVYYLANKKFTLIQSKSIRVPHTKVSYTPIVLSPSYDNLASKVNTILVFWTRKTSPSELESAVATLLMLHDAPIVFVRAFEK